MALLLKLDRLKDKKEWAGFGPEVTFISPPKDYGAWPTHVVALEVRDAAKARKFAEAIAGPDSMTIEGEMTQWYLSPSRADEWPATLLLTKTHLLWSSSEIGVNELAGRAGLGAPTLEHNLGYRAAVRGLEPPNGAFLYVDPATAIRLGGIPFPAWARNLAPWHRSVFPREAFARHLRPGTICVRTDGPGWLIESTVGFFGDCIAEQMMVGRR